MKMLKTKKGFTLIELMIVVAIIGILAAIAIPQFANLVSKSQEGATKGNLGTLRSALSIYYGDMEGWYPVDNLATLTSNGKYLQAIGGANLPKTINSTGHGNLTTVTAGAAAAQGTELGGWTYDNTSTDQVWGQIVVGCTHKDIKGTVWSAY